MPKNLEEPYRYTQNRELSWLRFDRRVLEEAADPGVPALERLKFVSIFSSNLDEFFMVRVGSLFDLAHMTPDNTDNKTGWTPAEQLHHIYRVIPGLLAMKQQIYAAVIDDLARSGVQDVLSEALGTDDLKRVNRFFKTELLPVLSPIVIAPNHPVPHLVNKRLYAAALLESKKGHRAVGIVPVPDSAPPYLLLTDGKRFVRTENILLRWLPTLFDAYTVRESCILAVTRNADISELFLLYKLERNLHWLEIKFLQRRSLFIRLHPHGKIHVSDTCVQHRLEQAQNLLPHGRKVAWDVRQLLVRQ